MKHIPSRILFTLILMFNIGTLWANLNEKHFAFRTLDINNGLLQNTVHAILQDNQGFMWFGTKDGLDRYDGVSFHSFIKESGTLGNNFVTVLYEDQKGHIWIGTDVGVYIYSPSTEKVKRFDVKSNLNTSIEHTVFTIIGDNDGGVWIASQGEGVFYYHIETKKLFNYLTDGIGEKSLKHVDRICFDTNNVCWLFLQDGNLYFSKDQLITLSPVFPVDGNEPFKHEIISKIISGPYNCIYVGTMRGLKEVNLTNKSIRNILTKDSTGDDIYVREIAFYSDDELWIGTEMGLYIHNLNTKETIHLQNVDGDPYSISDNAIYSICKDKEGGMWIGSYFGGVNYYPKQYSYFNKFYPRLGTLDMGKRVREFCPSPDGTLWIGTEDKGLMQYNPLTGKIKALLHMDIYRNVHGLCLDNDYLWVGTFSRGLNRIDLRNNRVKHYDAPSNDIFSIYKTTSGDLWIGSTYGLSKYIRETDRFEHIPLLEGIFIYHIKEDRHGNIWLATYVNGLYKMDVNTGKLKNFVYNESDTTSISSNKVLSLFEDSQNNLWITTQGGGFCRYEPSTQTFVRYGSNIGLPSNVTYRIEEDEKGFFWISTNKGLVHFDPKTERYKVYTTANGLLSNQFNYQSSYKDKNGKMYFGCINGFISFDPSTFVNNDFIPPVVITEFKLFNKKVSVDENKYPLAQSITFSNQIELKSFHNSFSLGVAALSYQSPEMNILKYKLEGFDTDWIVANAGSISYSNLSHGKYTLKLKGANSDGVWNENVRSLHINILPPFYLTIWAYGLYALLFIVILFSVFYFLNKRTKNKQAYLMIKFEQEKERELYMSKINFFTNVAHEIRTPLTLIKSPLESILKEHTLSEEVQQELGLINKNVERLSTLTNQLLDFRKAENKAFQINVAECNISQVVQSVVNRFSFLAKKNKLNFLVQLPKEEIIGFVDDEVLIKIVSNLLTNAFKYTETYVNLSLFIDVDKNSFLLSVSNDGVVIPLEKRAEIFLPFVQYENEKRPMPGTGIGLPLARSLAELHKGTLTMDQSEDFNCFILQIPIIHQEAKAIKESKMVEKDEDIEDRLDQHISSLTDKDEKNTLLIVEDNVDLLHFLARKLSLHFHVFTAENGVEALRQLENIDVDLVISDIMMPEMDGLELCHHLKSSVETSHIPIVLLTAKTNVESKIEGMEHNADSYIEKPFSLEYLKANITSILFNRDSLRKKFIDSPFVKIDSLAQTKADKEFIQKLNQYIAENLNNPELVIDDIAEAMHVGRSNLYRKLKGIIDMSPNEYLRLERLKKAAQLLKEEGQGVVDIAYKVGFNSPSYFSSCFKKQFGVLPKDFIP